VTPAAFARTVPAEDQTCRGMGPGHPKILRISASNGGGGKKGAFACLTFSSLGVEGSSSCRCRCLVPLPIHTCHARGMHQ
jgi:hypothetical protein